MSHSPDLPSEGAFLAPSAPPPASAARFTPEASGRTLLDLPEEEDFEEEGPAFEGAGDADELSLAEASELVGVSTRALRDRVQRGSLAARKVTREGRILSVVRRTDLLEIYGWMVAEGERKRHAEDAGAIRRAQLASDSARDPLGDAARQLRLEVDKLQRVLIDVTAEMRLVREAHVRQREQDVRARADHDREIKLLQERAAVLADEMKAQRTRDTARPSQGRTPWEVIMVVLLLTATVFALWVRFQRAEAQRADELQRVEAQRADELRTLRQTVERIVGEGAADR